MNLWEIQIENYKGFRDGTKIKLSPNSNGIEGDLKYGYFKKINNKIIPTISGFIGKNGSGKTSILDAIDFAFSAFSTRGFFDAAIREHKIKEVQQKIKVGDDSESSKFFEEFMNIIRNKKNAQYEFSEENSGIYKKYIKNIFDEKSVVRNKNLRIKLFFTDGEEEYKLSLTITPASNVSTQITYRGKVLDRTGTQSMFNELFKKQVIYNRVVFPKNFIQGGAVVEMLSEFLNKYGEKKLNAYLRIADSNIDEIAFTIKNTTKKILSIKMKEKDVIAPKSLSTGTIRFIQIMALVESMNLDGGANILMIDEVDNHLHPSLVEFIFKVIKAYSKNWNKQLFFTTHSPVIMSQISFKQGYIIENEGKINRISSVKVRQGSSFIKKYLEESISSHPDQTMMNKVIVDLGVGR